MKLKNSLFQLVGEFFMVGTDCGFLITERLIEVVSVKYNLEFKIIKRKRI